MTRLNVVSLFAFLLIISSFPCFSYAYGQVQLTDPQEVLALRAVQKHLKDPHTLNWSKRHDPCQSNWTGVICYFNKTDGHFHVQELRLLNLNLSGTLAPELGVLVHVKSLNFMWNQISGSIPRDVGNMAALEYLLLSGNRISGQLPDELGNLSNLNRLQLDWNFISGKIPPSLANLLKVEHFHLNNNFLSDQIPPEISTLPSLEHVLLDNNNLSGYVPLEIALMPSLEILQLDNNNFAGTFIPGSYGDHLFKLSLKNCSLQGTLPDLSANRALLYVDLSMNILTGPLPTSSLNQNITTIILSSNQLNGSIPANFSGLPRLQKLYLDNNELSGFVPTNIWSNINFTPDTKVDINLTTNYLSDVSGVLNIPENVTLMLKGNPVCETANQRNISSQVCGSNSESSPPDVLNKPVSSCLPQSCPTHYQYVPDLPQAEGTCFCAAPFGVEIRLRSPSISKFPPYSTDFNAFITNISDITLDPYQMHVDSIAWEVGPRLNIFLLFFPRYNKSEFDSSEILKIADAFAGYTIPGNDIFGPYDVVSFTALGPYSDIGLPTISKSNGLSKGAVAGIVVGSISSATLILAVCLLIFIRRKHQHPQVKSTRDTSIPRLTMKMDSVRPFSFEVMQMATNNFSISALIGQGGYGKVYRGTLPDGTVVAIKRALQGSLQGEKEFYTEIEILSRTHHRNLVSLVGYCDEKDEQMLVYEFMPNGSLHDLLSAKHRVPLNFATRLHIALGASKGILYLHTEADPPIIHRDIKANNILLDSKFTPKVADFGISRLAPAYATSSGNTTAHVSTNVKGTPGYVDPVYYMTHKLTEKSDVYSLGVVFLELLTGMRPISHGRNIVQEVTAACQNGRMFSVIDRSMRPYTSDSVSKFMALALRCSLDDTKHRPLMLEVVREIENIFAMLPESDSASLEMNINMTSNSGTLVQSGQTSSSLYITSLEKNINMSNPATWVGSGRMPSNTRSHYLSMDNPGSDLVSGAIPHLKAR